jgi:glycosyltransferase involved in cell wall biosynthesis
MTRVSCIIPAWNEATRIGAVLSVALDHPMIDEVIVVDDASTDDTAAVVGAFPAARLIRQPVNAGKTRAVATGVAAAQGDHVLLLDADLQGLTPDAITALVMPVARKRADTTISLRGNAPAPWRAIGLDYISGERVVPKGLLAGLEPQARFGLEVAMNQRILAQRLRLTIVRWPSVRSPLKAEKMGLWRGLRADAGMMRDIFRTIGPTTAAAQIIGMRRLARQG